MLTGDVDAFEALPRVSGHPKKGEEVFPLMVIPLAHSCGIVCHIPLVLHGLAWVSIPIYLHLRVSQPSEGCGYGMC